MSEQEEWGIASTVGMTSLIVAAGRAIESHRKDGLVDDPYAEAFVVAARPPIPIPTRPDSGIEPVAAWARVADHAGIRSRFFDDYLRTYAGGGGQAVILAAGLDSRAYRLGLPAGTRVFELDHPAVLEFKEGVLRDRGARTDCDRRPVPVDLNGEWAGPLRDAGFDPGAPSTWMAEGLLPYLPEPAQRDLLGTVAALSAPGSHAGVEYIVNAGAMADDAQLNHLSRQFGFDISALIPDSARVGATPPHEWLGTGWATEYVSVGELAARYGNRAYSPMPGGEFHFLTAHAG